MELILLQSIEGLGRPGDQVRVKAGYARNYLLPYGKATLLCADALRGIAKLKVRAEAEERAMLSSMEELAQKLAGFVVKITARATEDGHLFGSVTDKDVHAALAVAGWHQVPSRAVRMVAHLKEAGVADITLHLYGTVTAEIKVDVVPVDGEGNPIDVTTARAAAADAAAGAPADDATEAAVPDEAGNA